MYQTAFGDFTISDVPQVADGFLLSDIRSVIDSAYNKKYPLPIATRVNGENQKIRFFTARNNWKEGRLEACCGVQVFDVATIDSCEFGTSQAQKPGKHIAISRLAKLRVSDSRKGLGKEVLNKALSWARKEFVGHQVIVTAECLSSNSAAINLFKNRRFAEGCRWKDARADYLSSDPGARADYLQFYLSMYSDVSSLGPTSSESTTLEINLPAKTWMKKISDCSIIELKEVLLSCRLSYKSGMATALLVPHKRVPECLENVNHILKDESLIDSGSYILKGQAWRLLAYSSKSDERTQEEFNKFSGQGLSQLMAVG